jgi:quercetin dioxygenase-like cupin family protein
MTEPSTLLEDIRVQNVIKLSPGEGQGTLIGDLRVTWKAEGERTGYQFSVDEVTLKPGFGIPLHRHPFAEFIYVVEGQIDFALMNEQGTIEWISGATGDSISVPPNVPHTFYNHSEQPAKFLGVSTYQHELMLRSSGKPIGVADPIPTTIAHDAFETAFNAMTKNQCFVVEA